jgi:hypothetical protein
MFKFSKLLSTTGMEAFFFELTHAILHIFLQLFDLFQQLIPLTIKLTKKLEVSQCERNIAIL